MAGIMEGMFGTNGSGNPHDLGFYATVAALQEAHPTGSAGDFALVGETDTFWVWDEQSSAWVDSHKTDAVTSVNGQTGDVTVQDVLVNQTNIKSVNGETLLGSGNLELSTYLPYSAGWGTTGTTAQFCGAIAADASATKGKAYLGEVRLSDLPGSMVNAECVVEIMDGTTSSNKVIVLTVTSGNTAPYMWKYTYWNGGSDVSGWVGFQEEIQCLTLPEASASNAGKILQYKGATVPDVDAAATGTQTVGSGITDIEVDVATFEGVEQPTGAETVEFTASVTTDSAAYTTVTGNITLVGGNLRGVFDNYGWTFGDVEHNGVIVFDNSQDCYIGPNVGANWFYTNVGVLEAYGIQITGTPTNGDVVQYSYTDGSTSWSKDSEPVDITAYGVSYTGTVANGDKITVAYTPAEKGVTNGYFYQSVPAYSNPTAAISQTTGSGLSELAVDLDIFVATEQPTQSESAVFTASVVPTGTTYTPVTGTTTLSGGNIRQIFIDRGYDWDMYHEFWNAFIVFTAPDYCYFSNAVGGDTVWFYATAPDLEAYGFTIIGTPNAGDVIQYSYTDGSTSWTKGGETVNPADYGVSYSGAPNNGDALTVVYSAPSIVGYTWAQKDVQPASGAGGKSIEWKTNIDLPANWNQGSWSIAPLFKIAGGLPDGDYEFYYQMKVGSTFTSSSNFVPGELTFRYVIKIDNAQNSINGIFAPVIDGSWIGNASKHIQNGNAGIWNFGYKDDAGNLYFTSTENWFTTDVHGFSSEAPDIENCFRLTAIKNLATGKEYIATGELYNGQTFHSPVSSSLNMTPLQEAVYVPNSWDSVNVDISQMSESQTLVCGGVSFDGGVWSYSSEIAVVLAQGDSKFSARLQLLRDNYELSVFEASGIFANAQFVRTTGHLYLKLNLPVGTSGSIRGFYAMKDRTMNMGSSMYNEDTTGQSYVVLCPLKVGVTPTVANYLGKILQYEGATDANYTNGYYYKATGTVVVVPSSVTCTETTSYGKTISIDVDGFAEFMMTRGYNRETINNWLNNGFEFTYNVDNSTIWWSCCGDVSEGSQYFSFSPAAQSGEEIKWTTSNYVEGSKSVQNGAWERVDVQPAADPLPTQTGNAGKVLTTNGTTASWETPTTITFRTWGANE